MDRWTGKVAVVTGASVGIGAEIVKTLLAHGIKVAGLARRAENVQELAVHAKHEGQLLAVKCDVAKCEDIENAFQIIERTFGNIHILINNAGILLELSYATAKNEEIKSIFNVNVVAPLITIRETLKIMEKNKIEGEMKQIINISSRLGVETPNNPELTMYSATKHAIQELSRGLRMEMRQKQTNIRVSSICPGLVDTFMVRNLNMVQSQKTKLDILQVDDVAQAVVTVLSQPPHATIYDLIITPLMVP